MTVEDTIVAIATPFGEGAIALLRVSGRKAFALCQPAFPDFPDFPLKDLEPRRQHLARFAGPQGELIDQVLVTVFQGPASYTGEDVVEISCHGGLLVTREIYERLLASGCRDAGPGEFTQRAFLNGKMDLTQAEAVMDLITAQTSLALRAANEQLKGGLGDEIMGIREGILSLLAQIEAYIDFPDEDIAPNTASALQERLQQIEVQIGQLLSSADEGRILREGARVVICGEPNVGKSSLLNLFLGFDRAIVHAEAGTTRDTLEEVVNLDGIPLRLVDTAGLRSASDVVEKEGIDRAEREIDRADVILEVVDGHQSSESQRFTTFSDECEPRRLRILNKTDLGIHPDFADGEGLPFSCQERSGLDELKAAIREKLFSDGETRVGHRVAINSRHQACLLQARQSCRAALTALEEKISPEMIAMDVREALDHVGEVVGKTDTEDLLGEIFSTFCIGK